MMKRDDTHCISCGVPNTPEVNESLWDVYYRISDGRSSYEPLVFTGDWIQENVMDEEDHDAMMLAMERDMYYRGLCPGCARPNLAGVTEDMIMSDEDAKELQEMWAMEAQERRMGC
jgi:hypothetical protein